MTFCDDEELGAGRILLEAMTANNIQNCVVFIARRYGGIRMSSDRFECYLQAAIKVFEKDPMNFGHRHITAAPDFRDREGKTKQAPKLSAPEGQIQEQISKKQNLPLFQTSHRSEVDTTAIEDEQEDSRGLIMCDMQQEDVVLSERG